MVSDRLEDPWIPSNAYSQSHSTSSFVTDKESNDAPDNGISPRGRRGRRWLSSKLCWFIAVMAVLLFALILGLSIGLTQTKKPAHPEHPNPAPKAIPPPPAQILGPKIDLGYTTVQGLSYPGGISQWLGVRYAQPPVGNLRFAEPQNVTANSTVQMVTQRGNYCLGTRHAASEPLANGGASEDCLNLDIYAPANVTTTSALPVYVYVQGGGFNAAYPTQNGSSLVQASDDQIIVVSINYRVSVYGFLASAEIHDRASLNNGLKDQRMALQWIHDNIAKFGGDPKHVVIGGSSAGAGSVTLQLAAYGGRNDNLFHGSIAESQSFGAIRTVSESQYQYDELVNRTNCASSKDTLACLRGLDITTLQTQNILTRFPDTTTDPLFAYNPTLDHDFIQDYTLNLFSSGKFVHVPAIYGDVSNEGTVFVPHTAGSSIDTSNTWLQAQFPLLNATQLSTIQSLYPPEDQNYPKLGSGVGKYWRSTATAYGDLRYVCPGFFVNNATAHYAPKPPAPAIGNWNYHYNVSDPGNEAAGMGVPHVAEQSAIWASQDPASYRTTNLPIVPLMQQYWISFIKTFDPNAHKAPGAPTWDQWGSDDKTGGNRLLVQSPGPDGNVGNSGMESVDPGTRGKCETLLAWGVAIKQ